MITLKNPLAASEWIINLKEYPQVENALPMSGLNVRNDSNIVAYVDLDGLKVGEVQRYSADPFQGRDFSLIRIYNPDGQDFAADDLFIQATKGEVMGSQPFNPQWDMMFDDRTRFATGTDTRLSISDTVSKDMMKFLLNTYSGVAVCRRIDIQAHATLLGQITIQFNETDIMVIAAGIGTPPAPDTTLHKALITTGSFDYSETNAEIIGLTIDYLSRTVLPVSDIVLVTDDGPNDGVFENFYDGDLTTYVNYYKTYTSYNILWGISFPKQTIVGLSFKAKLNVSANQTVSLKFEIKTDGAWSEVTVITHTTTTFKEFFYNSELNAQNATEVRVQGKTTGGGFSGKLYELILVID